MYYNLLPQIRNAQAAGKDEISIPFSRMDFSISKILAEGGYIKDAKEKTIGRKKFIEIKLFPRNKRTISGVNIISKPSRHLYFPYSELRQVKSGYGLGVISTSRGVMTTSQARKQKVGGEYLFQIW